MKELAALKNIQELHLGSTKVTGAGIRELGGLKQLQMLDVSGNTNVTNGALKVMIAFDKLLTLDVSDTRVTDAGLEDLAGMKQLRTLKVTHIMVLGDGGRALMKALPALNIATGRPGGF